MLNYVPAGGRNPTPLRKAIVLAGQVRNKPLSIMAAEMVLRRMQIENATVHGFRSSFRDWAGNETGYPRDLMETALAHVIITRFLAAADAACLSSLLSVRKYQMQQSFFWLAFDDQDTIGLLRPETSVGEKKIPEWTSALTQ